FTHQDQGIQGGTPGGRRVSRDGRRVLLGILADDVGDGGNNRSPSASASTTRRAREDGLSQGRAAHQVAPDRARSRTRGRLADSPAGRKRRRQAARLVARGGRG